MFIFYNYNISVQALGALGPVLDLNLNKSDSGLYHTISLMYVGARHL